MYQSKEALFLQSVIEEAISDLSLDPIVRAVLLQILGRVEKDEGTRLLARKLLDAAALRWEVPAATE